MGLRLGCISVQQNFSVLQCKPFLSSRLLRVVSPSCEFRFCLHCAAMNDFTGSADSFVPLLSFSTTPDYGYDDDELDAYGSCQYERHGATFLPVLYAIFFVFGLVGNSVAIWILTCGVRLRSMTDVCLLNLALADLLLVCTFPFLAHQARDQWVFGDGMCKVVLGVYYIVFYCGIFFICLMSLDRYLAIVHAVYAMRARTRIFGLIAAVVIWVAGFIVSVSELIFLKQQSVTNSDGNLSTFCFPDYPKPTYDSSNTHFWKIFNLLKMNVLGLLIPIFILCFCYSQIIFKLLSIRSTKKQAIRLILFVVAAFFYCWVPYNIASFVKAMELLYNNTNCESSKRLTLALQVTEANSYFHSCLNPFLYVFVGEKFRMHLLRLINRAPCRLCQVIKVFLPQDRVSGSVYSQTTSLDERRTAV
ncbi:C-C chemokine receptor type 5-like isoform X2 [Salarias fasciatus]|uniref:C-C chemokine receptor type 5-like isoform X2 n=1 Tax=Salarias fasciatus TaxID=181472 RepID=UPI001176BF7A|nr:C-C chemokine receptor type 5-like isoform X2 [Salarias fasciatus]